MKIYIKQTMNTEHFNQVHDITVDEQQRCLFHVFEFFSRAEKNLISNEDEYFLLVASDEHR